MWKKLSVHYMYFLRKTLLQPYYVHFLMVLQYLGSDSGRTRINKESNSQMRIRINIS
jgi:hypothetical protein